MEHRPEEDQGKEPEEHLADDAAVPEEDVSDDDERAAPNFGRAIGLSAPD